MARIKPKDLTAFEQDIAKEYEAGKIRAPVHLRDGNEQILYDLFEKYKIGKNDYVFGTWASHHIALLKGIPKKKVKNAIMDGRSITLHFPEHKFYSSAIVGGIAPIATGTAFSLYRGNNTGRVFAFVGDMAFTTGVVSESVRFSIGHDLPITWVVEDNGKSVCTPTNDSWGFGEDSLCKALVRDYREMIANNECERCGIEYYEFESSHSHSGIGSFVSF